MKLNLKYKGLKFWTLFIGIGAIIGALMMWTDPSGKTWGMDPLLSILQEKMPLSDIFFKNFIPSGFVLLLVNGLTQFTAFTLLVKNNRFAAYVSFACGLILMAWTALEWILFGFNFLSNIYFIFGVTEALNAYLLTKKKNCYEK